MHQSSFSLLTDPVPPRVSFTSGDGTEIDRMWFFLEAEPAHAGDGVPEREQIAGENEISELECPAPAEVFTDEASPGDREVFYDAAEAPARFVLVSWAIGHGRKRVHGRNRLGPKAAPLRNLRLVCGSLVKLLTSYLRLWGTGGVSHEGRDGDCAPNLLVKVTRGMPAPIGGAVSAGCFAYGGLTPRLSLIPCLQSFNS